MGWPASIACALGGIESCTGTEANTSKRFLLEQRSIVYELFRS